MTAALALVLAGRVLAADAEIHFDRARTLYAAGHYDGAIREYDAVLRLKGDDAGVRNNMALCYLALQDLDKARAAAQRAVELEPKDGRYRVTEGVIELSAPKPDLKKARGFLRDAVALLVPARDHEALGNAYYNLGVVAQRRKRFEEARDLYRLALKQNPGLVEAQDALGTLGTGQEEEE